MNLLHIPCADTRAIMGISDDTRELAKDWLFVCRKGYERDGADYIEEALQKGAVVLCDQDIHKQDVYVCAHVSHIQQAILESYYGDLCASFQVIGITGTNGKTSVASMLSQLLTMDGKNVLQIGTGSVRYPDEIIEIHNTTPGSFQLANYLRKAKAKGISHVVMEVSSHAIDQNRISFMSFDVIVYTNITQDHLDYHITKVHYRYTKFKLRRYVKAQGSIVYNGDVPCMQELVHLAAHTCIRVGTETPAHFQMEDCHISDHDLSFVMQGYRFHANLLGMVNIYNLAEVIAVLRRMGYAYERLQELCENLQPVSGRMEVLKAKNFTIWIDYAHTADAIAKLLAFAQEVKQGRVIIVLGCGGERDRSKRPLMGQIAAENSDIAIFTSDNPRRESAAQILSDMLVHPYDNVQVFENRYFAIKHTIKTAQNSDIIIIAGKGSEESISAFGKEYPFSDRLCVKERLAKEELSWK